MIRFVNARTIMAVVAMTVTRMHSVISGPTAATGCAMAAMPSGHARPDGIVIGFSLLRGALRDATRVLARENAEA